MSPLEKKSCGVNKNFFVLLKVVPSELSNESKQRRASSIILKQNFKKRDNQNSREDEMIYSQWGEHSESMQTTPVVFSKF